MNSSADSITRQLVQKSVDTGDVAELEHLFRTVTGAHQLYREMMMPGSQTPAARPFAIQKRLAAKQLYERIQTLARHKVHKGLAPNQQAAESQVFQEDPSLVYLLSGELLDHGRVAL